MPKKLTRATDLIEVARDDIRKSLSKKGLEVKCPGCGGKVTVKLGKANTCPHCGAEIKVEDNL